MRARAWPALGLLGLCACATSHHRAPAHGEGGRTEREANPQVGLASYYGHGFAGRLTANGERFDPEKLTAAHRTLPFGTKVRVVDLENGRSVVVRITDRGPAVRSRIIDLSLAAARALDMLKKGIARVRLERQ